MNKKLTLLLSLCLSTALFSSSLAGSRGLSQYNSASFSKKLPVAKNTLECNSEDAKQFINSVFSRNGEQPSFIGGFKSLKKSKDRTYCSVTYKTDDDLQKLNYWIVSENNESTYYYDIDSIPIACDSEDVLTMIKSIAEKRKIVIEEMGGYHENGSTGGTSCSLAYKTSDIENVANLNYSISRDEDFNIVLETEENNYDN